MSKDYEEKYYTKASGNSFLSGQRKEIVDFINTTAQDGDSVLEVGCGTGEILEVLSPQLQYTGVDVSSVAVERARTTHKKHTKTDFTVLPENSDSLPFADRSFDVVVSVFSLEHFRQPKQYLNEMSRVLKLGGHMIILAPNLELPTAIPNAIRHRSWLYKMWFILMRKKDYVLRLFGVWKFRTVLENFTDVTGKYEKPDDDLTYVVSSYEVIEFLKRTHGMSIVRAATLQPSAGIRGSIKRMITLMPAMKYFGENLFVIMKKDRE